MNRRALLILWMTSLILAALACQRPGTASLPTETPAVPLMISSTSPTPNLTLTAVFAPAGATTPPDTPVPTATAPPDTPGPATTAPLPVSDVPIITVTSIMDTLNSATPNVSATAGPSPTGTLIPTATMIPTATLIPAPTITPISLVFDPEAGIGSGSQRPGPSLAVPFLNAPPVIDGDFGDWTGSPYRVSQVVWGDEYYANADDLSAELKLGWDIDFLYLGVLVYDTKFVQEASSAQLYRGDSLEILIDTNVSDDFTEAQLSDDDYQLGFSPGNLEDDTPPEGYIWAPGEKAGPFERVVVAARLLQGGYFMEVAIPWFMLEVTPKPDMHLGFLFSVSDNDAVNQEVQQTIVSFAPVRVIHDPTTWADLLLARP